MCGVYEVFCRLTNPALWFTMDGIRDIPGSLQMGQTQEGIHFDAAARAAVFDHLRKLLQMRDNEWI